MPAATFFAYSPSSGRLPDAMNAISTYPVIATGYWDRAPRVVDHDPSGDCSGRRQPLERAP